jgi:hypothetical protein
VWQFQGRFCSRPKPVKFIANGTQLSVDFNFAMKLFFLAQALPPRRSPLTAHRSPLTALQMRDLPHGSLVRACGMVTMRQQPQTAKGTVFVTLEDEARTGPAPSSSGKACATSNAPSLIGFLLRRMFSYTARARLRCARTPQPIKAKTSSSRLASLKVGTVIGGAAKTLKNPKSMSGLWLNALSLPSWARL